MLNIITCQWEVDNHLIVVYFEAILDILMIINYNESLFEAKNNAIYMHELSLRWTLKLIWTYS